MGRLIEVEILIYFYNPRVCIPGKEPKYADVIIPINAKDFILNLLILS